MAYDDLDQKILNLLFEDGRASLRSIAEELDVSVTTVSNHVEDMQDEGLIEGFKPVVNYPELGYTVTCVLMIKAEGETIPELVDELKDADPFTHIYEVTGEPDITAVGKFKDTTEMNNKIKELLNDSRVKDTNTSVVLSTVKEEEDLHLG